MSLASLLTHDLDRDGRELLIGMFDGLCRDQGELGGPRRVCCVGSHLLFEDSRSRRFDQIRQGKLRAAKPQPKTKGDDFRGFDFWSIKYFIHI